MRDKALDLIQRLPPDAIVLPVQTLGELFNARSSENVETSSSVMINAIDFASNHDLTVWDSVVLAASAEAECRLLLSEDLQEGFTWRGVTVANPFGPALHPLLAAVLTDSTE
jgi:predicted nucleic acid-binding protein